MRVELFQHVPKEARAIREKVFIEEQGFQEEFDHIDDVATHFVVYDDSEVAIATCRVFYDEQQGSYLLGRLAVTKEHRGKNIGRIIVEAAEKHVQEIGGAQLQLHAQCRITEFYNKLGYVAFGDVEDDQGCPHIWMRKVL